MKHTYIADTMPGNTPSRLFTTNFLILLVTCAYTIIAIEFNENDADNSVLRFMKPCELELLVWHTEVHELNDTLQSFITDGILDKHEYAQRASLVKESLDCLIMESMMWHILDPLQVKNISRGIQVCSETLLKLEALSNNRIQATFESISLMRLSLYQKSIIVDLESKLMAMRLSLLGLFYTEGFQDTSKAQLEKHYRDARQISGSIHLLNVPCTPEVIRLVALMRLNEHLLSWTYGAPLMGVKQDDFQLSLLHSMKLATRKVRFILGNISTDCSQGSVAQLRVMAKQGEFLMAKFVFLYFHPHSTVHLTSPLSPPTRIRANPVLNWLFEGIYLDLYKIARILRVKRYYLTRYAPLVDPLEPFIYPLAELVSTRRCVAIIIQTLLEQIMYSISTQAGFGTLFYRQLKFELWRRDADCLLDEFRMWNFHNAAYPRVEVLYRNIMRSTTQEVLFRGAETQTLQLPEPQAP
ncbi:hypothetical protein HF325_000748 [Metschnikowia pulcherrima]|uniref:Uncharacterized protein n=1 Tax=Metschnikowia pulcherrima TaxID=27326 RepID=A0A8H7LCQ1_9ASCO|nr:hypothetical protein HF325_000748 [Metschnikowia pulcherrima]